MQEKIDLDIPLCPNFQLSWTNSKLEKEKMLPLSLDLGNEVQVDTWVYRFSII